MSEGGGFIPNWFARAARRRGNRARDARDWRGAAALYRRYLRWRPDDFAIRVQLGHMLAEAGEAAAADAAYADAARLRPDDADLLLCRGHLRRRTGDEDGARDFYARSLAHGDDARAAKALAELEPAPPPAPAPGHIDHRHGRTVTGLLRPAWRDDGRERPTTAQIAFTVGDRVVGHGFAGAERDDGGFRFKTLLDIDGDVSVQARRIADGAELGNSPFDMSVPGPSRSEPFAWAARAEIVKPLLAAAGAEIALFVTHSANGALKPHVAPYLEALAAEGIAVLLIAVVDRPLDLPDAVLALVAGAMVRENAGYDFAAWAHAVKLHPEVYAAPILYLLNDSVSAPAGGDAFPRLIARVRASAADLVGLTESHEYRRHLQSYFLALKSALLASHALHEFFGEVRMLRDKDAVIRASELRFSPDMEARGYRSEVLFASRMPLNPPLYDWRALIAAGFPFVKLLPLRGAFAEVDMTGWRGVLGPAGFDLPLIDATLAAAALSVPADPDDRLVTRQPHRPIPALPKVAFFGPWNHDGEAGSGARGIVAALRRIGVPLNLEPVAPADRDCRPLGPAVAIDDFAGPADIAVVQVDAHAWDRLGDAQRDAVRAARKRIGCWPCDTRSLPEGWERDIAAVDRIWAPSAACADLLAAQDGAPADVIPPASAAADPAATAALVERSLQATLREHGGDRPPRAIVPGLAAGVAIEVADLGPRLQAVALGGDGAAGGSVAADLAADWIAFAPAGSLLHPLFARIVLDAAARRPDVALFYGDDIAVATERPIDQLRFKPAFDIVLAAAQDYVGAPVIVRAAALAALGGLRPEAGTAALDDLLLRAHAAGMSIDRIPEVLLAHPGARVRARLADRRSVVAAARVAAGCDVVEGPAPGTLLLRRRFPPGAAPAVTIVVPTRRSAVPGGAETYVERLLAGIAAADWPMARLTVLVGDDVAGEPGWTRAGDGRAWPFALRRIETLRRADEPFNYAAKMNRLWRLAESEQIVFVNDDVRPGDPGWLRALLTFAVDPAVGGVGIRLLYEDGRLQHAGLAPHGPAAAHPWVNRRRLDGTYQEWARVQRQWSMVTGAVFATRRSVMEEMNGFDERFAVEFNDSDLCLRMRSIGYCIVCTPDAEMVHVEKASRGEAPPPGEDRARFLARWSAWLAEDPAWHPRLRKDRVEVTPDPDGDAWYL